MSINMETALALFLLPIIGGIPTAAGQNALSNTTIGNIGDLVDNVTESTEEVIDDSLPLSLESIEDLTRSPLAGSGDDTSSVATGDAILINEV